MNSATEMRHRHRQTLARLAALHSELDATLQAEPPAPNVLLDAGRMWAELLCLLSALAACIRNLDAVLGKDGSFTTHVKELEQFGSELCRLHQLANRSTGADSDALKAASKTALEALLSCLMEWANATAWEVKKEQTQSLTATKPPWTKPPGDEIKEPAGAYILPH